MAIVVEEEVFDGDCAIMVRDDKCVLIVDSRYTVEIVGDKCMVMVGGGG